MAYGYSWYFDRLAVEERERARQGEWDGNVPMRAKYVVLCPTCADRGGIGQRLEKGADLMDPESEIHRCEWCNSEPEELIGKQAANGLEAAKEAGFKVMEVKPSQQEGRKSGD